MSEPTASVAVVTGASSGIGEATARLLARKGWHCVLVARRAERLGALVREIGGEIEVCDVGDRAAVEALGERLAERHPAIHLLVNNAGIPMRGSYLEVDLDGVEEVTRVNYLAGVWVTRTLLPLLQQAASRGAAHVVNVVSVAGTVAFAPAGAYAASKHAQLAFSRSLAAALAGSGIHVHSVLPGFAETEGFPQHDIKRNPLMRPFVTTPGRIAEAIVRAVERNRGEVTVPWFPYRLASVAQALVPGVMRRVVGNVGYRPRA